jgi:lipid II:glycine glycyltransferase (peptidoglycan interpeptide bridge formation enzyme)
MNAEKFWLHTIDLRPELTVLYQHFHKSSIQQKVQRAERENVVVERGSSEELIRKFYQLLLLTRRRHQVPPQPLSWFRNLVRSMEGTVVVHVASKSGQPIASILTLSFKRSLVYKYGCSDQSFHSFGGIPLLLWKAVQLGRNAGCEELDFGRSEIDNLGLVSFKERWGATRETLTYYRYPHGASFASPKSWQFRVVSHCCRLMPNSLLTATGQLLYRHIA